MVSRVSSPLVRQYELATLRNFLEGRTKSPFLAAIRLEPSGSSTRESCQRPHLSRGKGLFKTGCLGSLRESARVSLFCSGYAQTARVQIPIQARGNSVRIGRQRDTKEMNHARTGSRIRQLPRR